MGITGLLPALRPITSDVSLSDLKGLSIGVDTYTWLHKAVYSCAEELVTGVFTDKHITYALSRLDLLLHHGVRPYLVFDGDYLPVKASKEKERLSSREESRRKAQECMRTGSASSARNHFVRAVDVTPLMAAQFIHAARTRPGVRFLVAPYEADAQLGYLCRAGLIDAVITEDSDLLLFGCNRVIFKLDKFGSGKQICISDIYTQRNDELDFRNLDEKAFLLTCVLSGCDYVPSIFGIGLKKAHKYVSKHGELSLVLRALRLEYGMDLLKEYEESLQRALATFRHQVVYDPIFKKVCHLTPLPPIHNLGPDLSFLGNPISDSHAESIANGKMDPISREMFSMECLDFSNILKTSKSIKSFENCQNYLNCEKKSGVKHRGLLNKKEIPRVGRTGSLLGQRTLNQFVKVCKADPGKNFPETPSKRKVNQLHASSASPVMSNPIYAIDSVADNLSKSEKFTTTTLKDDDWLRPLDANKAVSPQKERIVSSKRRCTLGDKPHRSSAFMEHFNIPLHGTEVKKEMIQKNVISSTSESRLKIGPTNLFSQFAYSP